MQNNEFQTYGYTFKEVGLTPGEIARFLKVDPSEKEHPANVFIHEILNKLPDNKEITGGYRILPVDDLNVKEGRLACNNVELNPGRQVSTCLQKSEYIALFVCTAGDIFTGLTRRFNRRGDSLEAYITDAIGSLTVEKAMDGIQSQLEKAMKKRDLQITDRYSPGYCNWPVSEQKELFALLGETPVPVSLTGTCLMIPIKSISGVIGIGKEVRKSKYACAVCGDENCIYIKIIKK
ncbi:MAG: hypothetical protein LBR97_03625 [Dysgonamonadaceae bacterium]|jgi:hypothetical protein|nr:hypothetical protein [Dysgonamonadaceae bacterium]